MSWIGWKKGGKSQGRKGKSLAHTAGYIYYYIQQTHFVDFDKFSNEKAGNKKAINPLREMTEWPLPRSSFPGGPWK